jgi:hypothetical protein
MLNKRCKPQVQFNKELRQKYSFWKNSKKNQAETSISASLTSPVPVSKIFRESFQFLFLVLFYNFFFGLNKKKKFEKIFDEINRKLIEN